MLNSVHCRLLWLFLHALCGCAQQDSTGDCSRVVVASVAHRPFVAHLNAEQTSRPVFAPLLLRSQCRVIGCPHGLGLVAQWLTAEELCTQRVLAREEMSVVCESCASGHCAGMSECMQWSEESSWHSSGLQFALAPAAEERCRVVLRVCAICDPAALVVRQGLCFDTACLWSVVAIQHCQLTRTTCRSAHMVSFDCGMSLLHVWVCHPVSSLLLLS